MQRQQLETVDTQEHSVNACQLLIADCLAVLYRRQKYLVRGISVRISEALEHASSTTAIRVKHPLSYERMTSHTDGPLDVAS